MININFKDQVFPTRNTVEEFTIGEFETISGIMNDKDKNTIEKWSEIFVFVGLPQEVVDEFDTFAFIEVIKEFNMTDISKIGFQKEIVLNGITYKAFDEEFKLTVKEMRLIEDYIKKNENRYLGDMLAVIYKRDDIEKSMNFDKAHIHFKAELIRKEVKADVAIPYLKFLSKKLVKDFEMLNAE